MPEHIKKPAFYLIGLPLRTSMETAAQEIGAHWDRFYQEEWLNKIPNRLNDKLYGLYTDYEGDHTKPYTLIIGAQVSSVESVPEGMVAQEIPTQTYVPFETHGELPQSVINAWMEIWSSPLDRTYSADFEEYDGGVVTIFIAIK